MSGLGYLRGLIRESLRKHIADWLVDEVRRVALKFEEDGVDLDDWVVQARAWPPRPVVLVRPWEDEHPDYPR